MVEIAEKGYGCALRGGVEVAEYEYIVMGDADDSYDFSDLSGFIQKLDEEKEKKFITQILIMIKTHLLGRR